MGHQTPTGPINVLHQPSQSYANNMADVKSAINNTLLTAVKKTLIKNHEGADIEEKWMGVARSLYGRRERHKRIWWGNLKQRYHLEYIGIVGRIILK